MIEKSILQTLDLNVIVKDKLDNIIYISNPLTKELSTLNDKSNEFKYNDNWYKIITKIIKINNEECTLEQYENITSIKNNEEMYIKSIRSLKRDALTCLYNRHGIKDIFNVITKKKLPFSVILGDIDFFKKINDTYGHSIGDEALKYISETLKSNVRKIDYVGRYGGEEFLIILPFCDKYIAYRIAENIREHLNNTYFETTKEKVKITMTFGISEYNYTNEIEDVINEADEALYEGKESGRNTANIYNEKEPN